MKISVLITSTEHPIYSHIGKWAKANSENNQINILHSHKGLAGGDILFLTQTQIVMC